MNLYNKEELLSFFPDIYYYLNDFFSHRNTNYPCLYGIKSFRAGCMYFNVSNSFSIKEISMGLIEFSSVLSKEKKTDQEHSLLTYMHIINNRCTNEFKPKLMIEKLFDELNNIEYNRTPDEILLNFNDYNWFPVVMLPNHESLVRQSEFPLIAFQPYETISFSKIKTPEKHELMRKAIHKKIDFIFGANKPDYLKATSGINHMTQFAGVIYDKDNH